MQSFEIESTKSMDSTTGTSSNSNRSSRRQSQPQSQQQQNQHEQQEQHIFNESPVIVGGQHVQLSQSSESPVLIPLPVQHQQQQEQYEYPTTPTNTTLTISTTIPSYGTPTKRSNSNGSGSTNVNGSNGSNGSIGNGKNNNNNEQSISKNRRQRQRQKQQQLPLYERLSGSNRNNTNSSSSSKRSKTDLSLPIMTTNNISNSNTTSGIRSISCSTRRNRRSSTSTSSTICDCIRNLLINNLTRSGLVGILTGALVALFKLSIELVRSDTYSGPLVDTFHFPKPLIPVLGGIIVGILGNNHNNANNANSTTNSRFSTIVCCFLCGPFPPGLKGIIQQTDKESKAIFFGDECNKSFSTLAFFRKTIAAIFTLGTGTSLGPEGPSVELGVSLSRIVNSTMSPTISLSTIPSDYDDDEEDENDSTVNHYQQVETMHDIIRHNRLLLACGGAAGVAAGFNAPIAGIFFALEVIQGSFVNHNHHHTLNETQQPTTTNSASNPSTSISSPQQQQQQSSSALSDTNLISTKGGISSIVLSSVLSALVAKTLLGDDLTFKVARYALKAPLLELPLYLLLGSVCGCLAFVFSQLASFCKGILDGDIGPAPIRYLWKTAIPPMCKPAIGGLFCGVVGIYYPQVLFFGYETLNNLLTKTNLTSSLLIQLLVVKMTTTSVAAGSGLVGGLFAPSLFFGGMAGAAFHNIVQYIINYIFLARTTTTTTTSTSNPLSLSSSSSSITTTTAAAADVVAAAVTSIVGNQQEAFTLAELPAYAMIGSASCLAALFRAPLTASLILFECTREYDVILPLMASAGLASVVAEAFETSLVKRRLRQAQAQQQHQLQSQATVEMYTTTEPLTTGEQMLHSKSQSMDQLVQQQQQQQKQKQRKQLWNKSRSMSSDSSTSPKRSLNNSHRQYRSNSNTINYSDDDKVNFQDSSNNNINNNNNNDDSTTGGYTDDDDELRALT